MGVGTGVVLGVAVGKFGTELAFGRLGLDGETGAESTESRDPGVARFLGVLKPVSTSPENVFISVRPLSVNR